MNTLKPNFFDPLARYANFTLLAGLICVLAMIIIPLPPILLDLLLAFNLMGALTLLAVALSLDNSLQLATFPTLILMAALFRLALNLSSTRLILTDGYAGRIIETFGRFVSGGHLVVGGVMFFILTIIQFVVIAKGSERVAEVAARFSLDALPGQQMSIDADLRAGLISQAEAKQSRERLQKESRLFGAMDGAMKFVKGDAVAGVLITVVNLTGGLLTGTFVHHLPFQTALHRYGILTIGDGLVGQIPALLISITAGIIITRVSDEEGEHSLGRDIGVQIFSHPKALLAASGLAILLGGMPGFPTWFLFMLAAGLAAMAVFLPLQYQRKVREPATVEALLIDDRKQMLEYVGQAIPLVLEVGAGLFEAFQKEPRWRDCFGRLYPRLKIHLTKKTGVHFPDLRFRLNARFTEPYRYQLRLWDVPVAGGDLVRRKTSDLGPEGRLLRHVGRILKKHAGDFLGIQEVHNLLNLVEIKYPELVREVIPKLMSVQKLTQIVKRLVEEGLPVKDFRLILQTLAACQPEDKDPVILTEQVRRGMRRTLSCLYSEGGKRLNVVTIEPEIETEIQQAIQKKDQECFLVLPPERLRVLAFAFKDCFANILFRPARTVILTRMELRRYVRKIIDRELPHQAVLSYEELDPQLTLHPVGRVRFPLEAETVVDRGPGLNFEP